MHLDLTGGGGAGRPLQSAEGRFSNSSTTFFGWPHWPCREGQSNTNMHTFNARDPLANTPPAHPKARETDAPPAGDRRTREGNGRRARASAAESSCFSHNIWCLVVTAWEAWVRSGPRRGAARPGRTFGGRFNVFRARPQQAGGGLLGTGTWCAGVAGALFGCSGDSLAGLGGGRLDPHNRAAGGACVLAISYRMINTRAEPVGSARCAVGRALTGQSRAPGPPTGSPR